MEERNIRQVRRRKRRRQRRRAQTVVILLFLCVVAAIFYLGFMTGCSWQDYKGMEIKAEGGGVDNGEDSEADKEDFIADKDTAVDYEEDYGQTEESDTQWNLLLVNEWHPIPDDYEVNLVDAGGGECVDERIYEPLMEMLKDARDANWDQMPMVVSGYRTAQRQQQLYDEKIHAYSKQGYSDGEAEELAGQWVAMPGYSEHQLGLAVDINGATYDVYLWLQENSYKYGFIFRYPGHKTELTGVAEEVWHYRYVGIEAATEIYEQGICLEEYVEHMNQ